MTEKISSQKIYSYRFVQNLFLKKQENTNYTDNLGINFSKNQYHYFTGNDSIKSYVMLLPIINSQQIEKFITAKITQNKEKTAITKKNNYSY